jgi:adenylate cyclase
MTTGSGRVERKLAAIFAADVAAYSRLMSADGTGTLRTLTAHRQIMDDLIASHGGRIANTAGDSVLAEFPSVVDAVECAVAVQEMLGKANSGVAEEQVLRFRIGVHVGDVMVRGGDLLGDGVNVAARLEQMANPGGVCVSGRAYEEIEGKLALAFEDRGEQQVKNIARPVRVYAVATGSTSPRGTRLFPIPDRPSIAVLPFTNMSGDPEQEYFADGITEELITALNRVKWFFVIARNSSFTYKGRAVDVKQVGRDLGVRYVLGGSVRKSGNRLRITGQLIEASTGHHIWADRFDGRLEDVFELQDTITDAIVAAIEPNVREVEVQRSRSKSTESLQAYDLCLQALPNINFVISKPENNDKAMFLLFKAIALDPSYTLGRLWPRMPLCSGNLSIGPHRTKMPRGSGSPRRPSRLTEIIRPRSPARPTRSLILDGGTTPRCARWTAPSSWGETPGVS